MREYNIQLTGSERNPLSIAPTAICTAYHDLSEARNVVLVGAVAAIGYALEIESETINLDYTVLLVCSCSSLPRIPLIDDLTVSQIPPGSNILVEFDPASQWYNCCLTMAAGWAKTGGDVGYNGFVKPPDDVRSQLLRLGLNVGDLESKDTLRIYDWYTPTLGRKSREKYGIDSLKVADQSIQFRLTEDDLNNSEALEWPESLRLADNFSALARFNDEKSWIEFMLTRVFPIGLVKKSTLVFGIMKGVHSEWAYKQLEGSTDGIIDFRLDEAGGKTRDMMQIRTMRNVHFKRELSELAVKENFEIALR